MSGSRTMSSGLILHTYIIIFSFYFSEDLRFEPASPNELQKKPAAKDLVFGKHFTDHWLRIPWSQSGGWEEPVICKLENMNLHPGAKVYIYDKHSNFFDVNIRHCINCLTMNCLACVKH